MPPSSLASEPDTTSPFEVYQALPRQSLFRRFLTTQRHLFGLVFGALSVDVANKKAAGTGRGLGFFLARVLNACTHPFLDRSLRDLPFPVQLRRRLERLGPTYIKLGQILSLREDILPKSITQELKHLLGLAPGGPLPDPLRAHHEGPRPPARRHVPVHRRDPPRVGLDRAGAPRHDARRRRRHHQGGQARHPRHPAARRQAPRPRRLGAGARLPALRPEADHPGVLRVHAARGGPAPRGRQRGDLRGQLRGRARHRVPQDLSGVQRRAGPDDGVLRRAPAGLEAGAGDVVRGPRAAGRPGRGSHHPDDLQGRVLPRRPASRAT